MGQGPLTGAQAPYPWQHRWRYSGVWPCRPFPVQCQGLGRLHLVKVITVVLSSRVPRSHHSLKTAPPNTPPSGSYNLSGHFSEMPVATWKGWCTLFQFGLSTQWSLSVSTLASYKSLQLTLTIAGEELLDQIRQQQSIIINLIVQNAVWWAHHVCLSKQ